MKELTNYINEKLDINKVSLPSKEFPMDADMDEVVDFLADHDFIQIKYHRTEFYYQYKKDFNNLRTKCFMVQSRKMGEITDIVFFGDTSREDISKDNKLFMITFEPGNIQYEYYDDGRASRYIDKKDFEAEMTKLFK